MIEYQKMRFQHASSLYQSVLEYCQLVDFSPRSIKTLTARINESHAWMKSSKIQSVKNITYRHLIDFVADFKRKLQGSELD
jgi:hypothetical protein